MSTNPRQPAGITFAPCDPEAERRVLGILIKHPERVDLAVDRLKAQHFYEPPHRKVYQAILDLYTSQGRISYTQVYAKLRKGKALSAPDQVLLSLTESFVTSAELEPSIDILREKFAKRRILEAAEQIQQMVLLETEEQLRAYQSKAQELIFQATASESIADDDVKDLADILNKCFAHLVDRREGKRAYGLNVRFPAIDMQTTGFKNKDLIILAARPSMGKTALALNFAVNVARRKIPVLIFSLEMDDEQIGDRLVISEFFRFKGQKGPEISAMEYSTRLDDGKFAAAANIFKELQNLPIKIIDRRGLSVTDIRAKARRVKAENPELGLIMIDYLQLIKPTNDSNRNWALIVGEIVRELRDLAGELDLPIILLSQLNRSVESRENKRPMMSDLRDSGNIEEFADVVMFLYRDDYYYPDQAAQKGTLGLVEVIFAKQRKGATGTVNLRFHKEYTRFIDETTRPER